MKEKKLKKGKVNIVVEQNSPEHRRLVEATKNSQFDRAYLKLKNRYFSPFKKEKAIDIKAIIDLFTRLNQLLECLKVFITNLENGILGNVEEYQNQKFKRTYTVTKQIFRQVFRINAVKNPSEKESEIDRLVLQLYRFKTLVERDITYFNGLIDGIK